MKTLKKIGIVLLVLIGIVLIIALFIDKEFKVTCTVEIDHSVEEVYDYAKYLKNQ